MSWTDPPAAPVVHDSPLHRIVLDEALQLLGHDPDTVRGVIITADRVSVLIGDADGSTVEHRAVIV